jgi:hypothetical protein
MQASIPSVSVSNPSDIVDDSEFTGQDTHPVVPNISIGDYALNDQAIIMSRLCSSNITSNSQLIPDKSNDVLEQEKIKNDLELKMKKLEIEKEILLKTKMLRIKKQCQLENKRLDFQIERSKDQRKSDIQLKLKHKDAKSKEHRIDAQVKMFELKNKILQDNQMFYMKYGAHLEKLNVSLHFRQ